MKDRVYAVGRDTYARLYPNPGCGLCIGPRRLAISWHGGIEWFERHPKIVWRRKWSFMSRVDRPRG